MQRILNGEHLLSHGNRKARGLCLDIIDHGLAAADPSYNTKQLIRLEGNTLVFEGAAYEPAQDPRTGAARYTLTSSGRIYLFAIGKGIQYAAKAVEDILGDWLTGGYVIAKHGDPILMERIDVMLGGHPVPDECCVEGCRRMLRIILDAQLTPNDLVITIIGNGVSSLMTLPSDDIPLEDIIRCVEILQIENGIPTSELNHIRNNIDQLKGGRITKLLYPARMVHLLAVPPTVNDTHFCAGFDALIRNNYWLHTLPDSTSVDHALQYLDSLGITNQLPASILHTLRGGSRCHKGVSVEDFLSYDCRIFALMPECTDPTSVALNRARELGLHPYLLTKKTQCEARAVGKFVGCIVQHGHHASSPFHAPCAIVLSGELLVTCGENSGVGGRNQEFCLSAALALQGNEHIALAAVDTDGTDGPGGFICDDAEALGVRVLSGALIDGNTVSRADAHQIDLQTALSQHDVSRALWELGDGIVATHNVSVGDLACCVIL